MADVTLTEDELRQLRGLGQGQVPAVVTRIVAARVAAALGEVEARLEPAMRRAMQALVDPEAGLEEYAIAMGGRAALIDMNRVVREVRGEVGG